MLLLRVVKIYKALQSNCIEPNIGKMLKKNPNGFPRNRSTISKIKIIRRIFGVRVKHLEETILFVDISKQIYSGHKGNMEQIVLAYNLPKETVEAIMVRYKITNVKECSPDRNTDDFDIVAGMVQGHTINLIPLLISA